ncbi:MAG: alpha/beta hydrolase [Saprospiraceae bacterium]|nr:alpha/beta hydrolase [Saprospiraceae bacterium]
MYILGFLLLSVVNGNSQTINYPPPGELVDIGGYKLHLMVEGKNRSGPTIVFFHGAGDIALIWNLVLPKVGEFAKAVAIDQAGEGWSDHGYGMALNQQVYDSHEALRKGGYDPPYVIVGHSLGGIIANLFAIEYKDEVNGVVLVDATHPDVVLKIYNKETKILEWKKMRLTADESIPQIKTEILTESGETSSYQIKKDFGDKLNKFSERDQKLFNWIYNERPYTYIKGQEDTYEAEIFDEMYKNPKNYYLGETPLIVITGGEKS